MKVLCIKDWIRSTDCNGTVEVLTAQLVVGSDIFPLPFKAKVDKKYLHIDDKNFSWDRLSQSPAEIKKIVQECSCCANNYNVRAEQFLDLPSGSDTITLSEVANEILLVLRNRTAEYESAEWSTIDNQNIILEIPVGQFDPGKPESFIVIYK